MSERRNDLEIRNESPQIALQIPNSDRSPLYDVRYPARHCPSGQCVRSDVSRTIIEAFRSSISSGGARRDRTDDLMLAKHALSQLSYGPVPEGECFSRARLRRRYGAAAFVQEGLPSRSCRAAKAGGPGKT